MYKYLHWLRRPVSVRNSEHPAVCLPSLKREQTLDKTIRIQFPISIQRLNMNVWKILFITILYLQSKAQAEVAPNLEPFLSLKVGSVFISNGDYYWKEFQNSTNAIYAYYQSFDLHSSLFYPKIFQHKVHGKVAFFECGGGYPNTAIQVYGRGYLYCGNFNGTPTDDQLFHTFDETIGRISMQAVTFPGKFLTMWHNYPCVGDYTSCKNDDCRFTLEDPTNRPPTTLSCHPEPPQITS